jgi:hypothetical protein
VDGADGHLTAQAGQEIRNFQSRVSSPKLGAAFRLRRTPSLSGTESWESRKRATSHSWSMEVLDTMSCRKFGPIERRPSPYL